MRILLVNDDGIRAPGLAVLARAARRLGEVWVAAPDSQCSGMSQKLTIFDEMALHEEAFPVPVQKAWSLGGTPADCVKAALNLLLDFRPDYVFSGVNDGWNAGLDVAYSGTIGACLEAVMNGIPAIAFSARSKDDLTAAESCISEIASELIALGQQPGEIWNVNFPAGPPSAVKGILRERRTAPVQLYSSIFSSRMSPEGRTMVRQTGVPLEKGLAPEGSDIAAVFDGYISIGKVRSALF